MLGVFWRVISFNPLDNTIKVDTVICLHHPDKDTKAQRG